MQLVLVIRSERPRDRRQYGASTIMALAAGVIIVAELQMAMSLTVDSYLRALRLEAIAAYVIVISLVYFVRCYFDARFNVLYALTLVAWSVVFIFTMISPNLGLYSEVSGLVQGETFWGEPYTQLDGTVGHALRLPELANLLTVVFIALTAHDAWRRGQRQRALVVGGASIAFMLVAGIQALLDDAGILQHSMPIGFPFLVIVAALSYQLIEDRILANRFRLELEQLRRASLAGEIAAGLVHELNQPLTSILSNAQAARRYLDSDDPDLVEVRAAIEDVVTEDKRAAGIIHGLHNLLQRGPVGTTTIDVNDTVRRVVVMLAGEFNTGSTRLELKLAPSPARISADDVQIQQVLLNLLLNALRALRQNPPADRVVTLSSVVENGMVDVTVADTGPGISAAILPRIFEPFTSGGNGLGIGLSICRRIATLFGGSISAGNREEGGAEFRLTLPLAEDVTDR